MFNRQLRAEIRRFFRELLEIGISTGKKRHKWTFILVYLASEAKLFLIY